MALLHFFFWLSGILLYVCVCACIYIYIYIYTHIHTHHFFCIHLSVNGHLGCFLALAIVDSVAVNTEYMYLFQLGFSPGICPGVGLLDHWAYGEGVKKRELSCTVGGNENWCNHYGIQSGVSFKTSKQSCHKKPTFYTLYI